MKLVVIILILSLVSIIYFAAIYKHDECKSSANKLIDKINNFEAETAKLNVITQSEATSEYMNKGDVISLHLPVLVLDSVFGFSTRDAFPANGWISLKDSNNNTWGSLVCNVRGSIYEYVLRTFGGSLMIRRGKPIPISCSWDKSVLVLDTERLEGVRQTILPVIMQSDKPRVVTIMRNKVI